MLRGACSAKRLGGAHLTKAGDVIVQPGHGVLVGACGCLWWVGMTLGSWGAPGGACEALVQCEMVHCSAKGGMQVLVDAHWVLMGTHWVLIQPGAGHLAKVKVGER